MLYDSPKLTSAFKDKAVSTIEVQCWFQKELPFPDCDLSSLKPVQDDIYPREIENLLLGGSERNKSYI